MNRYPDKPATASDGEAFARLCVRLHRELLGEDVGYHSSALDQLTRGESAARIEFKELQKSFDRLHIEVSERTSLNGKWRPSGIYADERMQRYCCGNTDDIWVFAVADLRQRALTATDWYDHPTVLSMVLHKRDAAAFYLYRFRRESNGYVVIRGRVGFVGFDSLGRFLHYCHCGKWGDYGVDVSLRNGRLGTWFCSEHKGERDESASRRAEDRPERGADASAARSEGESRVSEGEERRQSVERQSQEPESDAKGQMTLL